MSDLNTCLDRLNDVLFAIEFWLTLAYSSIGTFIMVRRWWLGREATKETRPWSSSTRP